LNLFLLLNYMYANDTYLHQAPLITKHCVANHENIPKFIIQLWYARYAFFFVSASYRSV